jgi:hypothetical protein
MPPHIQLGHAIAIFNSVSILLDCPPNKTQVIYSHFILHQALETFIKRQENPIVTFMRTSKAAGTFTFMLMSATLLNYLRTNHSMFWFVTPSNKNHNLLTSETKTPEIVPDLFVERLKMSFCDRCYHKNNCKQYLLDGMKSNLKIGLLIEVIQALIKNFAAIKSNPLQIISKVWKSTNFKLTKFLVAYIGIYRVREEYYAGLLIEIAVRFFFLLVLANTLCVEQMQGCKF